MSMIVAVIFDLDGVLVNSEWLAFQVWGEWIARHGGTLPKSAFPHMVGITAEETSKYVMQYAGAPYAVDDSLNWIWRRVSERLTTESEPLPGAVELVDTLSARTCALAVASNSITSYVDHALMGLGLLDYFPVRVGIDQVAQGKPAPDVYLRAAGRLGVEPSRCLAVEDSHVGVEAAAAAGMRVIAVPGSHEPHNEFRGAWAVYESLVKVGSDLETVLR